MEDERSVWVGRDAAKLPWKQIAAFVAERGGYGFSFAGCRKKWDEICGLEEKEVEIEAVER